jgi:hypothetical protein
LLGDRLTELPGLHLLSAQLGVPIRPHAALSVLALEPSRWRLGDICGLRQSVPELDGCAASLDGAVGDSTMWNSVILASIRVSLFASRDLEEQRGEGD